LAPVGGLTDDFDAGLALRIIKPAATVRPPIPPNPVRLSGNLGRMTREQPVAPSGLA
jgi:hypothetical protein